MIVDQKAKGKINGVLVIGDPKDISSCVTIATNYKPNKIRQFLIKLILGWCWFSIENAKEKNLI